MKNSAVQSAVTQNINMLNKLHMAMIELYKGDSRRIQHFCKVHSYDCPDGKCRLQDFVYY